MGSTALGLVGRTVKCSHECDLRIYEQLRFSFQWVDRTGHALDSFGVTVCIRTLLFIAQLHIYTLGIVKHLVSIFIILFSTPN